MWSFDGGVEVTLKPLASMLNVREGFLALLSVTRGPTALRVGLDGGNCIARTG